MTPRYCRRRPRAPVVRRRGRRATGLPARSNWWCSGHRKGHPAIPSADVPLTIGSLPRRTYLQSDGPPARYLQGRWCQWARYALVCAAHLAPLCGRQCRPWRGRDAHHARWAFPRRCAADLPDAPHLRQVEMRSPPRYLAFSSPWECPSARPRTGVALRGGSSAAHESGEPSVLISPLAAQQQLTLAESKGGRRPVQSFA